MNCVAKMGFRTKLELTNNPEDMLRDVEGRWALVHAVYEKVQDTHVAHVLTHHAHCVALLQHNG